MAKPLDRSDFPDCASCPYAQHGPWHVCVACAAETLHSIQNPCPICSQEIDQDECFNRLCAGSAGRRQIERIEAVALHTEPLDRVIRRAALQDFHDRWPFDNPDSPALEKDEETAQSAGKTFDQKRSAASEHATALRLQHPERIARKRIILYDDICTTGLQLNAVAKRLREDWGANSVVDVVLARHPWRY